MCGVVGIASVAATGDKDLLIRQRDALRHRGPDDAGVWWSSDGHVGLAHRRLTIIDLTPAGHQPMTDVSGTLHITFNGEIYNFSGLREELESQGHVFFSQSDTEVILAAYREWGLNCLARLNGMFAFALYDSNKKVLFLARDRAGEKPLFYWHRHGAISFASELKALMADPDLDRRLDLVSLEYFFAFRFVPGERCIIKGLKKLPPAHAALFDTTTGRLRVWRYWELPPSAQMKKQEGVGEEDLIMEMERLLEDSVRRQLVADVPVGILLSGGVDSSLITATAARISNEVRTFTITFPGYEGYDESRHARLVAEHFSTEHTELPALPTSIDLLPELAAQFDEPLVDSSMIPTYMVCKLVRGHCTVALGGDGGDELFGGYEHYGRLLRLQRYVGRVPRFLRLPVADLARRHLPVGLRGRNYLVGIGVDLDRGVPHVAQLFDLAARRRLLNGDVLRSLETGILPEEYWDNYPSQGVNLLDRAQRLDFQTYLPEDILVKVDRTAMVNSLETRTPLLDHRIIEFAFGRIPSCLKANLNQKKILAKMLGKRMLPSGFDWERKQGFGVPLTDWLRKQWRKPFEAILLDNSCSLLNRAEIDRLWRNHQRGFSNAERLFGLALFELWQREYKITY